MACASVVAGIIAHFQALAMQRGHAHRAAFPLGITFSTIIFLDASFQCLVILMRSAGLLSKPKWSSLCDIAAAIEWLFIIPGILLAFSVGGRYDMNLIGGCVTKPKEGYETNEKVCIEWAMCLTFMILLDVTLVGNIFVSHVKGLRDDFYSWTIQQQSNSAVGTTRPLQPQPSINSSISGSTGVCKYDIPAAGPPPTRTPRQGPQGSEDLRKTSALPGKKFDGDATAKVSSKFDV